MGYLVYEMEAVKELRGQDRERVKAIAEELKRVEVIPGSPYIPHFEPLGHHFFKKRFDKQRLIAYRMDVEVSGGLVPVVVFLELLHRGDRSYGSGDAEHLERLYGDYIRAYEAAIRQFAEKEVARRQVSTFEPLPPLPESLRALLEPVVPDKKDAMIFHSEFWLEQYRSLGTPSGENRVLEAMGAICTELEQGGYSDGRLAEKEDKDLTLYFIPIYDPDLNVRHIFALGFTFNSWEERRKSVEEDKIFRLAMEVEGSLAGLAAQTTPATKERRPPSREFWDRISALSRIAYPVYVLADQELWVRVVASPDISIALSGEEAFTLTSLLAGERFPAIIEGRAGSGKTTLLNFFVPERVIRRPSSLTSVESYQHQLLYLTQSKKLLGNAEEQIKHLKQRLRDELGGSEFMTVKFQTFHDFALSQLSPERQVRFFDRYSSKGWLDFHGFRRVLTDSKLGIRERLSRLISSPEIIWFVLRSYIKGFYFYETGDDRWMTPEQYEAEEDLGKKDRQVSPDVFREIWENVWPWYKRLTVPCEENDNSPEFWDDLDLAWEVLLNRSSSAPFYAMVVCDEVQDFSRVEFAAILQAVEFLRYQPDPQVVGKLPIVLAGDSYQTVNPACFRWARLKRDCSEVVKRRIPQATELKIEPFQLTYNYRSRPGIGRLCNTLQFLRQRTFDVPGELQRIWKPEEERPNQAVRRLIIDRSGKVLEDLLKEEVLCIGPEPKDISDPKAGRFWESIGLPEGPPKHSSYYTPADFKGLEHKRLAVLGFGTAFQLLELKDFWMWDRLRDISEVPEGDRFAAEYFLNRLYVAISRPREQLWIIETEEGWDAFWNALSRWVEEQSGSIPSHQKAELISETWWTEGGAKEISEAFAGNFEVLADGLLQQAKETGNPEDAEDAAYYYGQAGKLMKESEARAWHQYLNGKVKEAAKEIEKVDPHQAADWLWEARAWSEILELGDKSDKRRRIAEQMAKPASDRRARWVVELAGIVRESRDQLDESLSNKRRSWYTWGHVLTELLEAACDLPLSEDSVRRAAKEVAEPYKDAPYKDGSRFHRAFAKLSYHLGDNDSAVRHWERVGDTNHQDYYLAKAQTVKYPESLKWLESAGDWDKIVRLYEINRDIRLSLQDRRRVLRGLIRQNRFGQAVTLAASTDSDEFRNLWRRLVGDSSLDERKLDSLIEQAYKVLKEAVEYEQPKISAEEKQTEKEQTIGEEISRRWSELLLDVALDLLERPPDSTKSKPARIWHPIVAGLSWDNAPPVFVRRLEGARKRVEEGESNAWELHKKLLEELLDQGLKYLEERWHAKTYEDAAPLSHLLVALVWSAGKPEEDESLGAKFCPVQVRDYLCVSEQTRAQLPFLSSVAPDFRVCVRKSLQAVGWGDFPRDMVRRLEGQRWREFRDLVDGIGRLFVREAQYLHTGLQETPSKETRDWLEVMGGFVLRTPFRRLASEFFDEMKRVAELWNWPAYEKKLIEDGRRKAEEDQQEYRESRKRIRVAVGEFRVGKYLEVRSLDRAPEVVIQGPPRYEQIRLSIELPHKIVSLSLPASLHLRYESGTKGGNVFKWSGVTPGGHDIEISWHRDRNYLVLEVADERFEVELALPST